MTTVFLEITIEHREESVHQRLQDEIGVSGCRHHCFFIKSVGEGVIVLRGEVGDHINVGLPFGRMGSGGLAPVEWLIDVSCVVIRWLGLGDRLGCDSDFEGWVRIVNWMVVRGSVPVGQYWRLFLLWHHQKQAAASVTKIMSPIRYQTLCKPSRTYGGTCRTIRCYQCAPQPRSTNDQFSSMLQQTAIGYICSHTIFCIA